ncbi:hypothetical protein BGZ60DRAFT_118643 [Tricladium varicosporioides]|nr:hypothetical protein BGZ60DRAFT_118643 [Hymenoscyphus varicosporioides]
MVFSVHVCFSLAHDMVETPSTVKVQSSDLWGQIVEGFGHTRREDGDSFSFPIRLARQSANNVSRSSLPSSPLLCFYPENYSSLFATLKSKPGLWTLDPTLDQLFCRVSRSTISDSDQAQITSWRKAAEHNQKNSDSGKTINHSSYGGGGLRTTQLLFNSQLLCLYCDYSASLRKL